MSIHFTSDKATTKESHTGQIAKVLFALLKERGFEKSLRAIEEDSRNVKTCVKFEIMRKVELHLGTKLVWLVCMNR